MTQETKIKIGDTFAYQIGNENPEFNGRYLIFNKVSNAFWNDRKEQLSVFRIKITSDKKIPKKIEELNQLEYVKISMRVYEERFYPFLGSIDGVELCRQKDKLKYYPDEFGYMYSYQLIPIDSITKLPRLKYIGNYKLNKPKDEYIFFCKFDIRHLALENIEDFILEQYKGYNLRKSDILYTKECSEKIRREAKAGIDIDRDFERMIENDDNE